MKKLLLLLYVLSLLSCTAENDEGINKKPDPIPSISMNKSDAIKKLAKLFSQKKILTRNQQADSVGSFFGTGEIESITPVKLENIACDTLLEENRPELFVVNYADNKGYLIVDASENNFPIVCFNNMGQYIINQDDSISLALLKEQYYAYWMKSNGKILNVWDDIIACMTNPELNDDGIPLNSSDTTCVTTIEFLNVTEVENEVFESDDEVNIVEDIPHRFNTSRSIPDRDYPKRREQRSYAMVDSYNLRWHSGFPYNVEMPRTMYNHTDLYGGYAEVPLVTISLSKILFFHRTPWKFGWVRIPPSVSDNNKSTVSNLLRRVSDIIGVEQINHRVYRIRGKSMLDLPSKLENDFEFAYGGDIIRYDNNEESFLKIYESLLDYNPVLFWEGSLNNNFLNKSWIVDGYQEICTKVTKSWYFCGIRIKRKIYYTYKDYFHFIISNFIYYKNKGNVYDIKGDGWFPYDYKTQYKESYALVNSKPR